MAVMHYGVWLLYSFDERNQRATFGLPLHTHFQKNEKFYVFESGWIYENDCEQELSR